MAIGGRTEEDENTSSQGGNRILSSRSSGELGYPLRSILRGCVVEGLSHPGASELSREYKTNSKLLMSLCYRPIQFTNVIHKKYVAMSCSQSHVVWTV